MTKSKKRENNLSPKDFLRTVKSQALKLYQKRVSSLEKSLVNQHFELLKLSTVPRELTEGDIGAIIVPTGGGPMAVHEAVRIWKKLSKRQALKPIIIPSGKIGVSKLVVDRIGPGVTARVMAEQLVEYGIPRDAVILDDKSTDTYEVAQNTGVILKERRIKNVVAVVETVHTPRFLATFIKENPEVWLFTLSVSVDKYHMGTITDDVAGFPYDYATRVSEVASMHFYSEKGIGPTDVHGVMKYLEGLLHGHPDRLNYYRKIYEKVSSEWDATHSVVLSRASRLRHR